MEIEHDNDMNGFPIISLVAQKEISTLNRKIVDSTDIRCLFITKLNNAIFNLFNTISKNKIDDPIYNSQINNLNQTLLHIVFEFISK